MILEEILCPWSNDAVHTTNPCHVYPFAFAKWVGGGRSVIGADNKVGPHIVSNPYAVSPTGQTFNGPDSSELSVSVRRVNASPRYVLSLFNSRGAQIGSTVVATGSLASLATAVHSDAVLGTMVRVRVVNDTNQTYDPDSSFSASRLFRWGG